MSKEIVLFFPSQSTGKRIHRGMGILQCVFTFPDKIKNPFRDLDTPQCMLLHALIIHSALVLRKTCSYTIHEIHPLEILVLLAI